MKASPHLQGVEAFSFDEAGDIVAGQAHMGEGEQL
jgi:hypothetical protein